jgi:hypothetical protein
MTHSTVIEMTSYTPEAIQLLLDVKTKAYTSRHIVTTKRRISGQLEIDVWHAIDATSTTVVIQPKPDEWADRVRLGNRVIHEARRIVLASLGIREEARVWRS